jgi:hypothetical protein
VIGPSQHPVPPYKRTTYRAQETPGTKISDKLPLERIVCRWLKNRIGGEHISLYTAQIAGLRREKRRSLHRSVPAR